MRLTYSIPDAEFTDLGDALQALEILCRETGNTELIVAGRAKGVASSGRSVIAGRINRDNQFEIELI